MSNSLSHPSNVSFPIIVHSHLQWGWVWQRPQQFLSRLAKRHPVLFIETHPPSEEVEHPRYNVRDSGTEGVTLLQVQFPLSVWHDGDFVDRERRRLVKEAISRFFPERFANPVQWFYDPMAVTAFAGHMEERAIVYDCMDELSKFKNPPPNIIERERELLRQADVVFTGGRKLYESKIKHNPNTHFYGCGVDVEHFGKAAITETPIAEDVKALGGPCCGYIGVVDERLDYELIAWLAEQRPQWNFIMVGPACKIDENDLPRRENLHWLGGRPYEALPTYAKAFDVCMMPFALNEATEYINPTKTLEYMATQRPIVSTPVEDVVANFTPIVAIARDKEAFLWECEKALQAPDDKLMRAGLNMANEHTWESIVESLEGHLRDALQNREHEETSIPSNTQPLTAFNEQAAAV